MCCSWTRSLDYYEWITQPGYVLSWWWWCWQPLPSDCPGKTLAHPSRALACSSFSSALSWCWRLQLLTLARLLRRSLKVYIWKLKSTGNLFRRSVTGIMHMSTMSINVNDLLCNVLVSNSCFCLGMIYCCPPTIGQCKEIWRGGLIWRWRDPQRPLFSFQNLRYGLHYILGFIEHVY